MQSNNQYNSYDKAVVACVRAAVWGEPILPDWKRLLACQDFWKAAYRQSCGHLLAVWAFDNRLISTDSPLKKQVFSIYQRTLRQNRLLTDLVTLFEQHNIPCVLLKGAGLSRLYPKSEMRDYGDIDLYIGEAHYDYVSALLHRQYPDAYWFSTEHIGHHLIMQLDERRDLVAEFHNMTMDLPGMPKAERAFRQFSDAELTSTDTMMLNGVAVAVPNPCFNVLYVFVHAWHHFENNGVGVRQLTDWMLAIHHWYLTCNEQDRALYINELNHTLRAMSMLEIWQTFGCVLVRYLGLPQCEFPLYNRTYNRRAERLYRQILHDGQGGRQINPSNDMAIHHFPLRRPEHNRFLQILYTSLRIPYDTFQLAKMFPHLACKRFFGNLSIGLRKLFWRMGQIAG